ncbi:GntR family transcriptional regulator [uncultured Sphaerochaeta sp.]|uniref:GntR family transcriptional regulator n=1 Tax=uncultured Sphaerochaeta sp. TaxID=886478 RepID=UPI002A0A5315|nr:GntR family transcriptional regulator [uncultured Sphaerochaeta sp.]
MEIIISNANTQPIYKQVCTQIQEQIVSGFLKEGDNLPSIRNLAKELGISVITIKHAYEELEKLGYINTVASKGCFVAARNIEQIREEYRLQIEGHMRSIMLLADFCNIKEKELALMYQLLRQGKE